MSFDLENLDKILENMTPKENEQKIIKTDSTLVEATMVENDLEEILSVSTNLEELNEALDFIEQRTDNIRAQLLELLSSTREIRQEIIEENGKSIANNDTEMK